MFIFYLFLNDSIQGKVNTTSITITVSTSCNSLLQTGSSLLFLTVSPLPPPHIGVPLGLLVAGRLAAVQHVEAAGVGPALRVNIWHRIVD